MHGQDDSRRWVRYRITANGGALRAGMPLKYAQDSAKNSHLAVKIRGSEESMLDASWSLG
jgi:hypothetical protein